MNEECEVKIHHGRNIKFFRRAKEINQDVFAEMIGVNQSIIARIEKQKTIEDVMLAKCANVLGISVEMIKEFDLDEMMNSFTYNIDKIENSNAIFSISKDSSSSTPTNYYYPIEKIMELNKQNADLYERMLQAEKEKVSFLKKLLAEKNRTEKLL